MLGISRQTDYAVRVVLHLACLEEGAQVSIAEISETRSLPMPFVRRLIKPLVSRGILASSRGASGGIRLARPPEDIRIGQIVRTTEGAAPIVECLGEEESACCIAPSCRLAGILVRAFDALYEVLDEYTLADLVGNRRVLKQILIHVEK